MGLDSSLCKKSISDGLERIYNRLVGEDNEYDEVLYWRKNHNLLDWFNDILGFVDNCEYYEITKDIFVTWLDALETGELNYNRFSESYQEEIDRDIIIIKGIINDNDFDKTKYYFYNWW